MKPSAFWAETTDKVKELLLKGEGDKIGPLLNGNFDRRADVCKISEENKKMIEAARSVGASAKFTGSGGAIIGTFEDDAMLDKLRAKLEELKIRVIRPTVAPATAEVEE